MKEMSIADWIAEHGKIILASLTPGVNVGDIRPLANMRGRSERLDHPFVVIRIATREEFEQQVMAMGYPKPYPSEPYFYEVSTD